MPPGATAVTHRGLVRKHNEDAVLVACDGRLLVCADGLGGQPAGEEAAAIAIAHVARALAPHLDDRAPGVGERAWRERLRRALLGASGAIVEASESAPGRRGMATTLVAAAITSRRAYVGHVGDVRAYLRSKAGFVRLTDDHSLVYERFRAGELDLEEARVHPERNVVTQALGVPEGLSPATTACRLSRGDLLLLCSDGYWETATEAELSQALDEALAASSDLDRVSQALLARALDSGAADNVSIVIYRH
jgi:protein phosphatase